MMRAAMIAIGLLWAAACGSSECSEDEVTVVYLGTSNDREECKPIPAECGAVGDCVVRECIAAMYDLCEAPAIGVGCSDTFPPTIISCNE